MSEDLKALVGQTLKSVNVDRSSDEIIFTLENGAEYKMYHSQDCCESVTIDDICGDIEDLIGSPILTAEERTSDTNPEGVTKEYQDSFTWTFYEFATNKGSVTLRWYGESNGYYSESVEFSKIKSATIGIGAQVDLKSLQGKKMFSGIDRETLSVPRYEGATESEDAEHVTFILDGKTYRAVEDPSDGYRSSMNQLVEFEGEVRNTFAPVEVFCIYRDRRKEYNGEADILELHRMSDGALILELGTDNTDDYYLSFVCNYTPENM